MEYRRMGNTGLKVSQLCLGCMSYGKGEYHSGWTLDEEASMPFYRRAIEHGINFFDTADVYAEGESERVLGVAAKKFMRRDDVVIASKFMAPMGPGANEKGASRKHIMAAVDASLRRLGMDHIDLYQQHAWDPTTPLEETLEALNDVVRAGKARYIGASNYKAWQFAKALGIQERNGWARFVSMQPQYNLIYREEEREMLPLCRDAEVGVIPWSPLARGFLAGNRSPRGGGDTDRAKTDVVAKRLYYGDADFAVQARLAEVAEAKGVPLMQVALAWVASRPGVTAPIVGATRLEQLDAAMAALGVTLTDEEVAKLEEPYQPRPVFGFN
jgi:aryl-alcohol dehydrogenase (NADP+)